MVYIPRFLAGFASSYLFSQVPDQEVLRQAPDSITKSIAIVGAGSAGLGMLQTLLALPDSVKEGWEFTLFEEREDVGGVWLPDNRPASPPDVPESPLYPQLHTNTPVPFMTYPGFPFPPGTPLYPSHPHIKAYHERFAHHYQLFDFIRFNHRVDVASWVGTSEKGYWNLTVSDGSGIVTQKKFAHLVVASGNHHLPRIPTWKGQEEWLKSSSKEGSRRIIRHSVYYRHPEAYANQTVVFIGYGSSSRDIASQVLEFANKASTSKLKPQLGDPLKGVTYKPDLSHFTADGLVFTDGTIVDADTVILATGYLRQKPFLEKGGVLRADPSAKTNISSQGRLTTNLVYIFPLYQHILSLSDSYPTNALAFIGLPTIIANCPSDVAQSLLAAYAITQPHILASREKLLDELAAYEDRIRANGLDPYSNGHAMLGIDDSNDYQDDLVKLLHDKGVYSSDRFVETWRRDMRDYLYLKKGWQRIEELGIGYEWTKDAETEEDWAHVMYKVNEWQRKWEEENGIVFQPDLDFYH
ncbi:hypothetical protein CPB83DRAFT_865679 [Crepidotus variabilis]|uniref:FAD/NAD(P)-binding domain-containing protein n=1 Tax=Crepidotus variabilis TaxID=179855 RepID=A0A9P6EU54_9AGAR|nr:hypothetical protein CPB83DRAFT_865679 [Crepidotus variabilis]